jgi:hypothetical protein
MTVRSLWHSLGLVMCVGTALVACAPGEVDPSTQPPLRPLIYTEFPNMTPEAAAVRERRLMRQLLEGASGGQWGDLDFAPAEDLPPLTSPQALGQALYEALINREEVLWEHLFVAPRDYAALVHVDMERAEEYVDVQLGKSLPAWELFAVEESSETPDGGLRSIFSVEELRLGQGRTIDGPVAKEGEEIIQYWGNVLRLRFRDTEIFFDLTIPKIFRLEPARQRAQEKQGPGGEIYVIASEVGIDPRLNTLLQVGLHLKPQLLRAAEYPYPFTVGNFWRYRRYNAATGAPASFDALDAPIGEPVVAEAPGGLDANEVILEVESVERYGPYRLIRLTRRYNDRNLSRYDERWVVTPRRIYQCSRLCVTRVQEGDLGWLLEYFTHQVPIYRFPLQLSTSWGAGGRSGAQGVFRVDGQWHDVETIAGIFPGSIAVDGRGPLGDFDPHYRFEQRRFFAPGKGLVRRVIEARISIVEELVEYRIIPSEL